MIKYFTIEDLLKHYLQKKFHILHKKIDLLKGDVTKLNRVLSHPLRVPLQGGCYSVVK